MNWPHIFRGPTGNPEIGRTVFGLGAVNGIVSPTGLQIWAVIHGAAFDIEKYCLAQSAMLVALAPLLFSIGSKDKDSATARQTNAQTPPEGQA